MKLIKIGSNPSCDIVLNSEYVSSIHAELLIHDNGDIVVTDRNSKNGTFVGSKKLEPNQEVQIKRGEMVKFADETLVWSKVPQSEKNTNYRQIVNIGSDSRNTIIIKNAAVSRFHASLKIAKDGKTYFVDNGSKNGTQVNGMRIPSGELVRVKKDDNIICGGEDISDKLAQYFKQPGGGSWIWISAATVAVIAIIGSLIAWLKPGLDVPNCYHDSVVYVRASFHYEVSLKDNPLNEENKAKLIKTTPGITYQATAFFLDNEGRLATNRHVAMPWDEAYREKDVTEALLQAYQKFIINQLRVTDLDVFSNYSKAEALSKLEETELGQLLITESANWSDLRAKIDRIQRSEIIVSGSLDYITVGYPGQYYTDENDFERCFVVSESKDKEVDLAILQLNKKTTPSSVTVVIDPKNSYTGVIKPLEDQLFVMGYPYGLSWGINESTHSLEPQAKETKSSKNPGRYNFEFDSATVGGSSGSPVVNKNGQLVGILSSGYVGTTVTYAVLAKYLKQMYEEEIGAFEQTYK